VIRYSQASKSDGSRSEPSPRRASIATSLRDIRSVFTRAKRRSRCSERKRQSTPRERLHGVSITGDRTTNGATYVDSIAPITTYGHKRTSMLALPTRRYATRPRSARPHEQACAHTLTRLTV
jgi:hypothetical protein